MRRCICGDKFPPLTTDKYILRGRTNFPSYSIYSYGTTYWNIYGSTDYNNSNFTDRIHAKYPLRDIILWICGILQYQNAKPTSRACPLLAHYVKSNDDRTKWNKESLMNYLGISSPLVDCETYTVYKKLISWVRSLRYGELPLTFQICAPERGDCSPDVVEDLNKYTQMSFNWWQSYGTRYLFSHYPCSFIGDKFSFYRGIPVTYTDTNLTFECNTVMSSSDKSYSIVTEFYEKRFGFVPETIYRTEIYKESYGSDCVGIYNLHNNFADWKTVIENVGGIVE